MDETSCNLRETIEKALPSMIRAGLHGARHPYKYKRALTLMQDHLKPENYHVDPSSMTGLSLMSTRLLPEMRADRELYGH